MKKIITAIKKNWTYATIAYADKEIKYLKKQQYKSILLVLFYPNFTLRWHKILEKNAFLNSVLLKRPVLYTKPYKCYLSSKWKIEKRLKVILDSYDFIKNKSFFKESINEKKILLKFNLKDNSSANIVFNYHDKFRNEGEMVLSIDIPDKGGIYYSLAFSFEELINNYWVIRIGCLQGANGKINNNRIRELHKNLYGMRPKALLVFIMQQLAVDLDIKEILVASNSIQAHRRKHLIHIPWKHTIYSDYDRFLIEICGELQKDGWYKLPMEFVKKDMIKIPSHKRAYYKKRYEMLDDLALKISNINFN